MMEQAHTETFFKLVTHPVKFRLFLLKNLPSAYFVGVRVVSVSPGTCITKVPYKWFSTNPFRSTYFACLSMAAEMSTGVLAMAHTYQSNPRISMLVTSIEGRFHKKATEVTFFTCDEGEKIRQSIQLAHETNKAHQITVLSRGINKAGDLVAEFFITWSFKRK